MRSLKLAAAGVVVGTVAGASLTAAASTEPCLAPAPTLQSYAVCEDLVPSRTMTADERDDWMRYCVDGGTPPAE